MLTLNNVQYMRWLRKSIKTSGATIQCMRRTAEIVAISALPLSNYTSTVKTWITADNTIMKKEPSSFTLFF